ncbi:MAG TPA: flagellar basal-body MS-ring/collar protein FliF, partial [Gammaproteobacteria bacterium]|nr:flagellar basal-body MS-ring/collar protein FliF [Gammaproteobacteria bacterium]
QDYVKRIKNILSPLVGSQGVRAQVAADLDFTVVEKTQESYNPDLPALRSEQTSEQTTRGSTGPQGVPGALSNQPPGAGAAPANAKSGAGKGQGQQKAQAKSSQPPLNTSKKVTKNYELDKTISHIRLPTGTVRRLSVAVVVDDKKIVDDNGNVTRKPWSDAELARFTSLVKEAVGFNGQRGDRVNVINASFQHAPAPAPAPAPSVWSQPWVWKLAREAAGAIGVLVLIFGVLRPVLRSLTEKGASTQRAMVPAQEGEGAGLEDDRVSIGHQQNPRLNAPGGGYENQITAARGMVQQDPKRVAQVVKGWVNQDG